MEISRELILHHHHHGRGDDLARSRPASSELFRSTRCLNSMVLARLTACRINIQLQRKASSSLLQGKAPPSSAIIIMRALSPRRPPR